MAYLDRRTFTQKLASIGTAGAIELALAAALLAGLSTNFVPDEEVPQITARNIPVPVPPPPSEPQPRAQPNIAVIDLPQPRIDIDTPIHPELPTLDNPSTGFGDVIEFPQPRVTPSPRFTAVGARTANDPSRWVTANDYPARDLREGNQGVTYFRVIVSSAGRAQTCDVTRSSGFPSLDKAVCAKVMQRARFEPATDETGAKVVGSYSSSVRWQIPR